MSEKKGFWTSLFSSKDKSESCCDNRTAQLPEHDGKRKIEVLGTGCAGCRALYNTVLEAVAQSGIDADVEKVEDLEKIMAYNVMSLPALVVDGKVVSKGQKLNMAQVKELIG